VDRSIENPDIFIITNIIGTLNLLNAAKKYWGDGDSYSNRLFLQVSTDEVYGSLGETGFFTEQTPLDPRSPYSASKASADMLAKAYFDTYKFPVIITRCSNNYGPYQFPEKLIPLMINNAMKGKPLPIYGDGLQIRDWLYVTDHCKAIDMVIKKGRIGEVYNIGGHNEHTNLFIVKKILKQLGKDESLITHVKDRKGHDRRYAIDPAKIKNEIGWQPETDFEEGIVNTVNWYLNNTEWVENVVSGDYQEYYKTMYGEA
jgi:dTDP-glucose 4,6-dehydratase